MSRWFRHYAGMVRDEKIVRVALAAQQPVERVVWVWGAILESAAEINDGGRYELDPAECAYFLRVSEGDITAIENALGVLGRVHQGSVARWGDRQFQSDRSAERQQRYRERHKKDGKGNNRKTKPVTKLCSDVTVTLPSRNGDAPETETETETENKTNERDHSRTTLDRKTEALVKAAAGNVVNGSTGIENIATILDLEAMGCDFERDICPAVSSTVPRLPEPLRTWGARFIRDAALANQARRLRGRGDRAASLAEIDWDHWLKFYRETGANWPDSIGPSPDLAGCRAPPDALARHGYAKGNAA